MEGLKEGLKEEFIRLTKLTGWSQVEIARRLDYTPQTINGIITGAANPSKAMMRLFRDIIAQERPDLIGGESKYPERSESVVEISDADLQDLQQLKVLREKHPERYLAIKTLMPPIDSKDLPVPVPPKDVRYKVRRSGTNLMLNSEAIDRAAAAGSSAIFEQVVGKRANPPAESSPSSGTDGPGAHTSGPSRNTRKPSETAPVPPKPHPKK